MRKLILFLAINRRMFSELIGKDSALKQKRDDLQSVI
jgi:hypothetical protein